jgi:hypothetical protein
MAWTTAWTMTQTYFLSVTKFLFSGDFITFFLELDLHDALSAVPTYDWRNVPERSCANDDVITQITTAIEDIYIPIEQLTFQSVAAHRSASERRILGPGRKEDCNSWDRTITIFLFVPDTFQFVLHSIRDALSTMGGREPAS